MNKKQIYFTIIIITTLFLASILITFFVVKNNREKDEASEPQNIELSETIEDECTEEYLQEQALKQVVSTEEKISTNSQLILKKYYTQCEHTINEYVEMPEELINMTREEVEQQYSDWKVIGFEPNKVTLYKEIDDVCGEHFKLKIEDGKINIYIIDKEGNMNLYEKTNISSEYLTETDLINIESGNLEIYGTEDLNRIIEDFE